MSNVDSDSADSSTRQGSMSNEQRRLNLRRVVSSALELLDDDLFDIPSTIFTRNIRTRRVLDESNTVPTLFPPPTCLSLQTSLSYYRARSNTAIEPDLKDSVHGYMPRRQRPNDEASLNSTSNTSFDNDGQSNGTTSDHVQSSTIKSSTKRQVRFATLPLHHDTEVICMAADERFACWWGAEFIDSVKHDIQQISQRCRHSSRGQELVATTLQYTRDVVNELVASTRHLDDQHVFDDIMIDPAPYSEEMVDWMHHSGSRRGLERYLCLADGNMFDSSIRGQRPQNYRHIVLSAYAAGESDATVSRIACNASLRDRLLARMIGYADAKYVVDDIPVIKM
jgi:hypothetical protein